MSGKKNYITILLAIPFVMRLCICSEGYDIKDLPFKTKGELMANNKYLIGRFSLSLPAGMVLEGQSASVRKVEIVETKWPQTSDKHHPEVWKQRLAEISKLHPPHGVSKIIIEERSLPSTDQGIKAVYYYGNHAQDDEGFWDFLLDAGETGVWFKHHGLLKAKEYMYQHILEITKAYIPLQAERARLHQSENPFGLKFGVIDLSYKRQESTYARFEAPHLDLKLEIETTETHIDEPKEEGLLARTAAAILTGFAAGVHIKKIRSGKRDVAGLKGEEQVLRMKADDETELNFTWRYAGKKDSGEYPKIVVTMTAPEGNLREKLKLWDAILDSMRPLYQAAP